MDSLSCKDAVCHTHLRQAADAVLLSPRIYLLRERTERAHKWTKASAVTPIAASDWSAPLSQLGVVVSFVTLPLDNELQLFYESKCIHCVYYYKEEQTRRGSDTR